VKLLGVWINASLKDNDDIHNSETSEITILCSKQTQRHFRSVFPCSKKHVILCLLHANVLYACQLWSKYKVLTCYV